MYGGTVHFRQLGTGYGLGCRLSVVSMYVYVRNMYVKDMYVCMLSIIHVCTSYVHVHTHVVLIHPDQDEFSPLLSFDRNLSYVMIIINNFDSTLILEYLLHL